jgi:hypothetical protein
MKRQLTLLFNRLRHTGTVVSLRLLGLTLAAALAATVPTFTQAAMERVLQRQLVSDKVQTDLVVAWTSPSNTDFSKRIKAVDRYLREEFPAAAGLPGARVTALTSTEPLVVQLYGEDDQLLPRKRYLKLGVVPAEAKLAAGRLPVPGKPEVLVPQAMERLGYNVGSRLQVILPRGAVTEAVTLEVVGLLAAGDSKGLSALSETFNSTLFIDQDFWSSLEVLTGQASWAVHLPPDELQASGVKAVVTALRNVPVDLARWLPDAEIIDSPAPWLKDFADEMAATSRFLLVLLTPVFVLVLFLVVATAQAVADSRLLEVAVLRSRGAGALRVIGFYLPESLLLTGLAVGGALALTGPLVQTMGLAAGFLQLVGRPPLPVVLTQDTVGYALAAALVAELAALVPLVRATRFTVVTLRQEESEPRRVLGLLRIALELGLLALLGYATWRLQT